MALKSHSSLRKQVEPAIEARIKLRRTPMRNSLPASCAADMNPSSNTPLSRFVLLRIEELHMRLFVIELPATAKSLPDTVTTEQINSGVELLSFDLLPFQKAILPMLFGLEEWKQLNEHTWICSPQDVRRSKRELYFLIPSRRSWL